MIKEEHKAEEGLGCLLYYPGETDLKELPLLVYLHGAGERGENLSHVERHGVPYLISQGREYEAIVLCPQCPAGLVWDNVVREVRTCIDGTVKRFSVLPDRIVLTGSSMGGFGTFMMGMTYPDLFAGIGPVAGGGMEWRAGNLKNTPVYALHGTADTDVPLRRSADMAEKIRSFGGDCRFVSLENMGHNDGIAYAYSSTDLVEWLLSCRKRNVTKTKEAYSEWF